MTSLLFPRPALPFARISLLFFALSALSASAALTGYLKIGDIPGESLAVDHEDEIDIHSMSWAMRLPNDGSVGSGRARARVEVGELSIRKRIDKASPYLALSTMQGKSFPDVILTLRKDSGDSHLDYLIITMENVIISSYSMNGDKAEDGVPEEQVSFIFERVTYRYVEARGDEHEIEYGIAAGV